MCLSAGYVQLAREQVEKSVGPVSQAAVLTPPTSVKQPASAALPLPQTTISNVAANSLTSVLPGATTANAKLQ